MEQELRAAIDAAKTAGELILDHYHRGATPDWKDDHSPVTAADREAEVLIRDRLLSEFPSFGFLGEEFAGSERGDSRWVVDPIDGTKSFVAGVPLFSTLIGLEREGEPVLGVAHFPALGETLWASVGGGAFLDGQSIHVSREAEPSNALVVCGSLDAFRKSGRLESFLAFERQVYALRTWGDAYGHCLVAKGRAEVMLDPAVHPWDVCAISPIVREAGGSFTGFSGQPQLGSEAVSTNGLLLDTVTRAFNAS
jgi:histidinol-phosphatase